MTFAALETALDRAKPQIAERYSSLIRGAFARMVARHGASLNGVSGDWDYARLFRETVRPCCIRADRQYAICDAALAARSSAYAAEAVSACRDKIMGKIGNLSNVTFADIGGVNFRIIGYRSGQKVEIEQSMILNFSKLGKPFNQFPARIRVDGKSVSEKAYKEGVSK